MHPIGSEDVARMEDSDSVSLLTEIEQKRQRIRYWPFAVVVAFFLAMFMLGSGVPAWLSAPCIVVLAAGAVFVYHYDQLQKCVVLMYDLEGPILESYQDLHGAIDAMARCGAVWRITAKGNVHQPKYHAGAKELFNRDRVSVGYRNPPFIKTNLSVPFLPLGKISLYLLPDRVLVFSSDSVGVVDYVTLRTSVAPVRFIEQGAVPYDAKVVDHTWKFVNKDGLPDRRFNSNRPIPICQYEEMRLESPAGIREVLQVSRLGTSACFESAITGVTQCILQAEEAEGGRLLNEASAQPEIENCESQEQVNDTVCETSSATVAEDARPSAAKLYEALFDLLCCIMVADGRVSSSEKATIADIMVKLKSGWTGDKCDLRVNAFIAEVKTLGFSSVCERSIETLPMFTAANRENTVIKCIQMVAKANGKVAQREQRLCKRIVLRLKDSNATITEKS